MGISFSPHGLINLFELFSCKNKPGVDMKITVDLDSVLSATGHFLVDWHNRKYKTSHAYEDISTFDLWIVWGCSEEEGIRRIGEFNRSEVVITVPVLPGAQEGIDQLADHELYVLTSRPETIETATRQWVDTYFPRKFQDVYFSHHVMREGGRSKGEVMKDMGAELHIEDCLAYAQEIAEHGLPVVLLDCPWNQNGNLGDLIHRVSGWQAVVEKVKELSLQRTY